MTHGDQKTSPPESKNTSQDPLGRALDSGKGFWILGNFFWILILGRVFGFWEVFCPYEPLCLEIIRHLINMNEKIFLISSQKKKKCTYLSHNKIVQKRF